MPYDDGEFELINLEDIDKESTEGAEFVKDFIETRENFEVY